MRNSQHGSGSRCALAPSRGSLECLECQGFVTVPWGGTCPALPALIHGLLEFCPRALGDWGSARSDSQNSRGFIRKTFQWLIGEGVWNLCSFRIFSRIYWLDSCLQHGMAAPPWRHRRNSGSAHDRTLQAEQGMLLCSSCSPGLGTELPNSLS